MDHTNLQYVESELRRTLAGLVGLLFVVAGVIGYCTWSIWPY